MHTAWPHFKEIVNQNAGQIAIVSKKTSLKDITYKELSCLIERCNAFYISQGITCGNSVATVLPNSLDVFLLYLSAFFGGYSFAPVTDSASNPEIFKWCQIVKPKLILADELQSNILQKLVPNVKVFGINIKECLSWLPDRREEINDNTKSAKLYLSTSGTTGTPKAIVANTYNVWKCAITFREIHGLTQKLRFWNYLPMSYFGGMLNLGLIPLSAGASIVIDEPFTGKTFLTFWKDVAQYRISCLWLVPSIIRGLILLESRNKKATETSKTSQIKKCFLGTAPINLELKQQFESAFNLEVLENFALTETIFIASETSSNRLNRREGSVGEIIPNCEIKLVNIDKDASDTSLTELYVKTPYMFDGYLTESGELCSPFDKDGFMPTGDLGCLDNNVLVITGRNKDIIKKGGHHVSLVEIELLVKQMHEILDVAAVKINHHFYGESYQLYVVADTSNKSLEKLKLEVTKLISDNLIKYKWPENIIFKDKLPKTSTGKIKKHLLLASLDK